MVQRISYLMSQEQGSAGRFMQACLTGDFECVARLIEDIDLEDWKEGNVGSCG